MKKSVRIIIKCVSSCAAGILLCCSMTMGALANTPGRVTASVLNVREQPSIDAHICSRLKAGDIVSVINREGDWFKVDIAGEERFLHADYVALIREDQTTVSRSGESVSLIDKVLETAIDCIGVKYRFGGESKSGFDCSGFVRYVFRNAVGQYLPRTTYDQVKCGVAVSREEMRPGDLLFFRGINHVGIYMGDNTYIHSPQTGRSVSIDPINRPIEQVRRIITAE